jgi:competence ComEA-like helix-hairpin-helix protein
MTHFHLRVRLAHLAIVTSITRLQAHVSNYARAQFSSLAHWLRATPARLLYELKQLPRELLHHTMHIVAIAALILSMGGTWMLATNANAAPGKTPTTAVTTPSAAVSAGAANAGAVNASGAKPSSAPLTDDDLPRFRPAKKEVTGKLNLNTATEEQLMLLPSVGPSKAERVVTWRKKNGGFKRTADIRRVKGFGYKTFKRLEPFLDIRGDTTLAPRR